MKNLFRACMIVAGIAAFSPAMAQKFGHINSQELLLAMPERAEAEKNVQAYAEELKSQLAAMESEWNAKVADFQGKEATMTPLIRDTKMKEIQDLETRIRTFQETAEEEMAKKQSDVLQPMIDKAKKAIDDVAKENKFTYIFDTSTGSILYSPDSDDVMPLVKKKLGIPATATTTTP